MAGWSILYPYSITLRLILIARIVQDHDWTDGAWYRLETVNDPEIDLILEEEEEEV